MLLITFYNEPERIRLHYADLRVEEVLNQKWQTKLANIRLKEKKSKKKTII